MKRIAISLLLILTLILSMALVACDDDEYDEHEEFVPNTTEKAPLPEVDPEDTEADDVLGVGADTDDSWGAIQRN